MGFNGLQVNSSVDHEKHFILGRLEFSAKNV